MHWRASHLYPPETQSPIRASSSAQPVWLWPNLLSLDAPLVAVLWLNLFARAAGLSLLPVVPWVLGVTVWLIYGVDRVLDVMSADAKDGESARHQFCREHRKGFVAALAVGFVAALWMSRWLDAHTLRFGALLMIVVGAYFAAVHSQRGRGREWFPKEMGVGLVFAAGTFLPVWVRAEKVDAVLLVAVLLFATLCWLNAALIEYSEWVQLRGQQAPMPHSFTGTVSRHVAAIATSVALVAVTVELCSRAAGQIPILPAISLSAAALAGLGLCWRRLPSDAVRVLADMALLAPGFVLLVGWR